MNVVSTVADNDKHACSSPVVIKLGTISVVVDAVVDIRCIPLRRTNSGIQRISML